ncbi:MAG TPA: epoxyqueuosine reductase QueH [Candidatus Aminicenantes bacterium]|nr:epoxyqueuosine reductase QueH [Candidatus Aminicenantes bacterium]
MIRPRLLLHVCCGPCAAWVVRKLRNQYDVTGFFFNPNVHPEKEYIFRLEEVRLLARSEDWPLLEGEWDMKAWVREMFPFRNEPERGKRCGSCFRQRLRRTFERAREKEFSIVASTLSISPYKVTRQINTEGEALSREFGIAFLPENFKSKDGWNHANRLARELGIQHQNYCGCVYSQRDRLLHTRRRNCQDSS